MQRALQKLQDRLATRPDSGQAKMNRSQIDLI